MSYEKVKAVSFRKKTNQIFVTSACNNCRPLTYERWEYLKNKEMSFDEKKIEFWLDVMRGNFQFLNSCKWIEEAKVCTSLYRKITDGLDFFFKDYKYKTHCMEDLYKAIVTAYVIKKYDFAKVLYELKDFKQNSVALWQEKEKEYQEKGIIFVQAVRRLNRLFPDYILCIGGKDNSLIVAPTANYPSSGLLNNADNSAINLGPNSYNDWNNLTDNWTLAEAIDAYPALKGLVN